MQRLDQAAPRLKVRLVLRLWSMTNVRLCVCVSACVCYTPIMKKNRQKTNNNKKKRQNTIWYVIMYESVLVLFEFG